MSGFVHPSTSVTSGSVAEDENLIKWTVLTHCILSEAHNKRPAGEEAWFAFCGVKLVCRFFQASDWFIHIFHNAGAQGP